MAKLSARGRTVLAHLTYTQTREDENGPYKVVNHRVYASDGKILTKTVVEGVGRYKGSYVIGGNYPVLKLDEIIAERRKGGWVVKEYTDPLTLA